MVVDLSERVDSSLSTAVISNPTSGSVLLNITRERDKIRNGIERSEKLILQLISTRIPTDYVDISLIRKCNTIDLPALHSATKTCEKSLLKYLSFAGVDNSYCDHISALLDKAEAWGSHIVQTYTNAEVHSIKGSPGDVANVGVFSDNADKTIFEFLESFELGYIDWGNNRQRASKLLNHLSDDLKDKLITRSDNYALMRELLVQNYGGAARIINDKVMALARRKKPLVSGRHDRYLHISAIIAALQRLEKLMCSNPTLGVELKDCLYSRNTLNSLTKLLISQDYEEYIKEMTRRDLDWRNPLGKETYKCFRYICVMEKNMLEAARDNGGFSSVQAMSTAPISGSNMSAKSKSKGAFATLNLSDPESEDEVTTSAHVITGNSTWIKPGSTHKFPCPLQNHDHEIAACSDFLTLTPKDRWFKIPRGCICYTCLKPKGECGEIDSSGIIVCRVHSMGCCKGLGIF